MRKFFSTRISQHSFTIATLLLRLTAGLLLMANYGFTKLSQFTSRAPHFANPFGLGPTASYSLVVFAEFFCAALVVLGLFTRLACIPIIIVMVVALTIAHKNNFAPGHGETAILYLLSFLVILLTGPGKLSVDRLLFK
jgi:putative oxidoreductase